MRWIILMVLLFAISCGATSRGISERIARDVPEEWQVDAGLQPWLDEEDQQEERSDLPIAHLAPEWEDEEGNPSLPIFEGDPLPIAGNDANPY